jgi:hypothetical protein
MFSSFKLLGSGKHLNKGAELNFHHDNFPIITIIIIIITPSSPLSQPTLQPLSQRVTTLEHYSSARYDFGHRTASGAIRNREMSVRDENTDALSLRQTSNSTTQNLRTYFNNKS